MAHENLVSMKKVGKCDEDCSYRTKGSVKEEPSLDMNHSKTTCTKEY